MPTIPIRWADNTKQLRDNLAQGLNQIEATKTAADKMAKALGGENLIRAAHNYVAAVQQVGGANKLTAEWQAKVNATVTRALEQYKAMGKEAPKAMIDLANATKSVEKPTQGLLASISGVAGRAVALGSAVGSAIGNLAASAIKSVVSGLADIATNGIKLAPTVNAFNALTKAAGESGQAMLSAGRSGTKGLISDLDLMAAANKGLLLGLPITAQSFGMLAQTAVVLGKAMGQGPVKSFDDLITALGRSSPLILDNLGLSVKVGEANDNYAKSVGKTAEQLTDAEKKLAFYNAAMDAAKKKVEEIGGLNLTLADRVQQAQVAFKNFTDALGVAIAVSPVMNAAFGAVSDAIGSAFGSNQTVLVQRLIGVVNTVAIGIVDVAQSALTGAGWIYRAWSLVELLFDGLRSIIASVGLAFGDLIQWAATAASYVPGLGDRMSGLAQKMAAFNAVTRQSKDEFAGQTREALAAVMGHGKFQAAIDGSQNALAGLRVRMVEASKQSADSATIADQLVRKHDEDTESTKKLTAEQQKYADALAELNSVGADYTATLNTMSGTVVEAIRYYLKAGVSQAALAEAFKLTAAQVKAVASALEDEQKAFEKDLARKKDIAELEKKIVQERAASLKDVSQAVLDNLKAQRTAEDAHWEAVAKQSMSAIDFQLAQVDRWEREEKAKLDQRAPNWQASWDAIGQQAKDKIDEIKRTAELDDVKLRFTFVGPEQPKWEDSGHTLGQELSHGFSGALSDLPGIITQAFANGGSIMSALRAVASRIGEEVGKIIGSAFGKLGEKIGAAIGSLAGPAVEKLYDVFTTSAGEDVMHRIGRDWGIAITEAMGDQIAEDAKNIFNGNRQAAELWNIKAIVTADPENLGITTRNIDMVTRKMRDLFSMIQAGQMTIAQAAKVIDENWQDMVAAGTDAFGFLSDGMKELIRLDRQYGTNSKEITAYLKQQADVAVAGSNAAIAAVAPLIESWKAVKQRVDDALKAWDEAKKRGDRSAMIKADQEWAKAQAELTALTKGHKQELEDLGTVAVATFAAAIASGKSFAEALEAAGPGLQQLVDGFQAMQTETDNAALKALMLQSQILNANPALVKGVSSLGSAFAALSNMGMLNVDTFNAMTRTGQQMYARLQGEVAKVGGTTRDALLPMQAYLHQAQKAAEELGIPLDENTQRMIDQSKELGIWQEAGKTANEKMLDGIQALVDKMDQLLSKLFGLPSEVNTDVNINTNYRTSGEPPADPGSTDYYHAPLEGTDYSHDYQYGASGGRVTSRGLAYFSVGRLPQMPRPMGNDIIPGMFSPDEMILTPSHQAVIGALIARAPQAGSGGSTTVQFGDIRIEATGADLQDMTRFAERFNEGVRRNTGGMLDAVKEAARRVVVGG